MTQTFLDALTTTLLSAGEYNRHDQTPPAAILWTDKERLWEPLVPLLRERLPLLVLGEYAPEVRSGPAIWLRCAIAGLGDVEWPEAFTDGGERVPILYLPGVSRAELRNVEAVPRLLQPLAELQYRGIFWSQKNARDWTPYAFLVSQDGGLGIEVTADNATRAALGLALTTLASESLDRLRREAPLNASFFDRLLAPDPSRSLLDWLNDPEGFRGASTGEGWVAFKGLVKRSYGIDPEADGPITAARMLGERKGAWDAVWQRFAEAPDRWPQVADQLRAARPAPVQRALFEAPVQESWPQDNDVAEDTLRGQLLALASMTQSGTRDEIGRLEQHHGPRREWVWARLRQAPLAQVLGWLVQLAEGTARPLGGSKVEEIASAWSNWGWRVDDAALRALASADRTEDNTAVSAAVRALYQPWLEHAANAFQEAYRLHPDAWRRAEPVAIEPGSCLLFSDALRLDIARRLAEHLDHQDLSTSLKWRFSALPGVTPTAKPAISPVADQLSGSAGFDTAPAAGGSRLTADRLRSMLEAAGYQVLRGSETGTPDAPDARGWTELGAIDRYGHDHGAQLARHLDHEIRGLTDRIQALLAAGWRSVIVVTDHGWLLLPGGLPKAELPQHFTEPRKGRAARIRAGQSVGQQTVPWHWDASVQVAIPPGIACYEAGKEYEHGGLSPQECVVPMLTVSRADATGVRVTIADVQWNRMWCRIALEGAEFGTRVDLRTRPGDASSSVAGGGAPVGEDGGARLPVEDYDLAGERVMLVVVDSGGTILAQSQTRIGG